MRGGAYPDVGAEALLCLRGLLDQPLARLQLRVQLGHRVLALLLGAGRGPGSEYVITHSNTN